MTPRFEKRLIARLGDREVKLFRRKWKRYVEFIGGAVSVAVPIQLFYRGARSRAQREAMQLRRYGYLVQCLQEKKTRPRRSVATVMNE